MLKLSAGDLARIQYHCSRGECPLWIPFSESSATVVYQNGVNFLPIFDGNVPQEFLDKWEKEMDMQLVHVPSENATECIRYLQEEVVTPEDTFLLWNPIV